MPSGRGLVWFFKNRQGLLRQRHRYVATLVFQQIMREFVADLDPIGAVHKWVRYAHLATKPLREAIGRIGRKKKP